MILRTRNSAATPAPSRPRRGKGGGGKGGGSVESLEEVRNAKTRRMRMRLVAPDGRRGEAGDRSPAARQAGPQHGGRDQGPGARPGQTRVINQTLARPGVERRACR